MELWLITAALGGIVLSIIYWFISWTNNYWKKRGVKHIPGPPLVGVMKDLLLKRKGYGEIYSDIYKKYQSEKFVGYFELTTPSILIRDPELVNRITVKDFAYFKDRFVLGRTDDLFSSSFSTLRGDSWSFTRHAITPGFSSCKMKSMFGTVKECSQRLTDYLEDKTNQAFHAKDLMLKVILNITGRIAFGMNIDTLDSTETRSREFLKHSTVFFSASFALLIKFLITMSMPKVRNILRFKLVDNNVETFFRTLTKEAVRHRRETGSRQDDFLQLMIDLKEGSKSDIFTDDFMAAETFMYISGGSETVAIVLEFILYELASHQDLQKKVQDEISEKLSSNELNYETLSKFIYMEQFINETLRRDPIILFLFRMCTKDYKIPGTDIVIEKGTFVHIPIEGFHTDPKYFDDPETFNPDRFEDMKNIPKNVFYPFGSGPRVCIGQRLAILQIKVLLATLLSKYTVTLNEKTVLPLKLSKAALNVFVKEGVWVNFNKR